MLSLFNQLPVQEFRQVPQLFSPSLVKFIPPLRDQNHSLWRADKKCPSLLVNRWTFRLKCPQVLTVVVVWLRLVVVVFLFFNLLSAIFFTSLWYPMIFWCWACFLSQIMRLIGQFCFLKNPHLATFFCAVVAIMYLQKFFVVYMCGF